MPGSACSARNAWLGLQAPRITCEPISSPSLLSRVACMSISVMTPNPCCASADRTSVTTESNGRSTVVLMPYATACSYLSS